jgi:hypothetical protein
LGDLSHHQPFGWIADIDRPRDCDVSEAVVVTQGVLLRIFVLEGQRHHGELLAAPPHPEASADWRTAAIRRSNQNSQPPSSYFTFMTSLIQCFKKASDEASVPAKGWPLLRITMLRDSADRSLIIDER